jgi:acyl-homoserine lactone synthase
VVEIVTPSNRKLYRRSLDDMHRLRYRVAVENWGWRIPGIAKGFDKDDFDTDDTIYFLAYWDGGDRLVGCGRLNPTTQPHMLSEVFPHLCDLQDLPRDSRIYEFSRYIVDHEALSPDEQLSVRGRIGATINRFCLRVGVTHLTWFAYQQMYARAIKVWDTSPLGLPKHFEDDDATYIAAISEMNESGLARMRTAYKLGDAELPLVVRRDWADLDASHLRSKTAA